MGNIFFLWARRIKNFGVVDIAWGLFFPGSTLIAYLQGPRHFHHLILLIMVAVWGIRLSLYLFIRNVGKAEDHRYMNMRKSWGENANFHAYFKVFLFQPVLSVIIALPVLLFMNEQTTPPQWIFYFGVALFLFGFLFETIADTSLYLFKRDLNNKGKVFSRGVWSLCRHPNYFGEFCLWWGIFLASGMGLLYWWTIIGPLTISFFLMKVSGVPLLETRYKEDSAYREYVNRTNTFFPWFPKS